MIFSPADLLRNLADFPPTQRYLVAFSGGMDSSVLLDAMAAVRDKLNGRLEAIHIDHGLHPDSPRWTQHCREFCDQRKIPFINVSLGLEIPPGESLEGFAREARYSAIGTELCDGDIVLTAHHQDDQAETFLLHLMRGSGLRGLSSMPEIRVFGAGWLVRPLLEFSRDQLADYAESERIEWVDDPSNVLLDHDRNFLRHEVIHRLKERWPSAQKSIASSIGIVQESEQLLEAYGQRLLQQMQQPRGKLSVAALQSLDYGWRRVVIREWLRQRELPVPPRRRLDEILVQLESSGCLVSWESVEVRRYRDALYADKALPPHDPSLAFPLSFGDVVQLPSDLGSLRISGGAEERCEVRFRQGGEVLRWHGHDRPLKDIFQHLGIPPWLRERIPLIIGQDDALCAVADLVNADFTDISVTWERGPGWPEHD